MRRLIASPQYVTVPINAFHPPRPVLADRVDSIYYSCSFQVRGSTNENIDDAGIAPESAFEVFMGKRYDTRSVDMSDSIARNARLLRAAEFEVEQDGKQLETPLQKLRRLQAEAAQLSEQLSSLTADASKDEAAASTDPRVWAWGEMQQSLSVLQQQLVDYTTEEKLQPYLNPNFKVRRFRCPFVVPRI